MKYRLTTRGRIVAVVFAILVITAGVSLYDTPNVSNGSDYSETSSNGTESTEETSLEVTNNESVNDKSNINEENNNTDELAKGTIIENETVIDEESKILRETVARVYFKPDKYNLADNEIVKIDKLVEIGLKYPDKVIVVEGNINGYPQYDDTEFGKTLSEKRAEVIRDYLIEKGIKKEMIHNLGLGSKKPIENTSSVSDSWKNRRTDIYFKGYNSLEY